ncbi:intradiol ring-cleavage dioxygenase [Duganella sp. BJB488]|uniref:intradiol ring-cleavage dioxygenase n=1 Tax=unclassified Duganella TaxID=2636909 RepID=UPI000E340D52|nr:MULTISPECIES: intradiol ring-cleavage dioxygenase [unclassified Duganella]RFP21793.1 intradiol ring-cleavage dioxygenase [Duganella sp. BJB489]RFP23586.1 intradiol ring-cleavage dioxygenase [Duganella sp. BJB488]RFP38752.1 intradiol ring-cleavage dioxygenase [Duganella sp. BJB480]
MTSHDDDHEHSLAADLSAMLSLASDRRRTLRWLLAGASALPVLGCGGGGSSASDSSSAAATTTTTTTPTTGTCAVIPEETGGPYPGDGTNSNTSGVVNVLTQSGVVRSDIRSSFNGPTGVAAGVPLTIKLQIVNANGSCAVLSGYAVYLWHCDRDGNYSLYSNGVTDQNYLRGVQASDSNGNVTFQTIFPGCYSGRMPHVHFEVYPTLAKSTSAANRIKTSQFTFPMATLNEVYATAGYSTSVRNLAQISYATDNIFSDGYSLQMGAVTGNASDGYVVTLTVGVAG